jgi:general secretion pathway protein G
LCIALACRNHVDRNVGLALHDDLTQMRKAIAQYHAKHNGYPRSLHDLVRDGDLRMIPVDPVTESSTTWRPTLQENVRVDDFSSTAAAASQPEIVDVHSGATGNDERGRAWSSY